MNVARVVVLGIGNVLIGDDGFGPYAARLLAARFDFDEAVEVLDAGTPGLDFLPYLDDTRALLVLDTVSSEAPPGTVKIYRREQILSTPLPPRVNPHQPGLREALLAAELTTGSPGEVVLIGVVPASTTTGSGLSPAVRSALEPALAAAVAELERLGVPAIPRAVPGDPDIWWERGEPA